MKKNRMKEKLRRGEAVLEAAPDWLDSAARARVEGAINGLSWPHTERFE